MIYNVFIRTNNLDIIQVSPTFTTFSNSVYVNANIGIGITNPSYKLDVVNGTITSSNNNPTMLRVASYATSCIDNTNNNVLALFGNNDNSKGLAICQNGIITAGSTANQDLNLQAIGNANIYLRTNNSSIVSLSSTSTLINTNTEITSASTTLKLRNTVNGCNSIEFLKTSGAYGSSTGYDYKILNLNSKIISIYILIR